MANNQAFLDKNGLVQYHTKLKSYMLNTLPEKLAATDFKKGTLKLSDLPCYTSDKALKFSGTLTTGYFESADACSEPLQILLELVGGGSYSGGEISQELCPYYTVIIDDKVYDHLQMIPEDDYSRVALAANGAFDIVVYFGEDAGSGDFFAAADNWDSGHDHTVQIYRENVETVHKLDPKYLTTASAIAAGDNGAATGAQVYNYVMNAISGMTGAMRFCGIAANAAALPDRTTVKAGDVYIASGTFTYNSESIESGDLVIYTSDGSPAGDGQAAVNGNFGVVQANITNAVTGPSSAVNGRIAVFDGSTGKKIKAENYTISSLQSYIMNHIPLVGIDAGEDEIEVDPEIRRAVLAKVAASGSYNDLTNKPYTNAKVATGRTLNLLPDNIEDFVEIVPTSGYSSSVITDYNAIS